MKTNKQVACHTRNGAGARRADGHWLCAASQLAAATAACGKSLPSERAAARGGGRAGAPLGLIGRLGRLAQLLLESGHRRTPLPDSDSIP